MQPTVGLAALVSLAAALGGAAPAPSASCPAALTVWSFEGGFGIDESWTVRILDVRADRGRVDELTVRSAAPRWPAAEVRWFAASTPEAEPYALTTGTRT